MWTLSSDLGCAPVNCTRVLLKRMVWGWFMWTPVRLAADVNAIVPNHGSEPLLMTYLIKKIIYNFLTSMTDALQAESSWSHFCSPSAYFRAFVVHSQERLKCYYVLKLCKQNEQFKNVNIYKSAEKAMLCILPPLLRNGVNSCWLDDANEPRLRPK